MGFWSTIGGWISTAARVVTKVVKGVNEFLDGASVSDGYRDVIRVMDAPVQRPSASMALDRSLMTAAMQQTRRQADDALRQAEDALRQVEEHRQQQAEVQQRLVVRGQVMELALQASAFDRYANNIQLHAAGLGIHLQNIRNISGLLEDVNALRFGLKRTMGTVNHLANIINHAGIGRVEKLAGIDVERDPGAISIRAAHSAFEQTRRLLAEEISAMIELAEQHLRDVRRVQIEASAHGAFGRQISDMLETRITPQLTRTRDVGQFLLGDVGRNFPMLPDHEARAPGLAVPPAARPASAISPARHGSSPVF